MSDTNKSQAWSIDIDSPKVVKTEAGEVEYRSADDLIKLDKYKKQVESGKVGVGRVRFSVNKVREF